MKVRIKLLSVLIKSNALLAVSIIIPQLLILTDSKIKIFHSVSSGVTYYYTYVRYK